MRQLRGISAKWLLPLDKSLATCLPRNATLDLDIKHGMHVAKHYHKGGRTQVQGTIGRQQGTGTGAWGKEAWVIVKTVVEGAGRMWGAAAGGPGQEHTSTAQQMQDRARLAIKAWGIHASGIKETQKEEPGVRLSLQSTSVDILAVVLCETGVAGTAPA